MSSSARKALGAALLTVSIPVVATPYVDKVLDEGIQPALVLSQELSRSPGWSRGWRVEYSIARDSGTQRSLSQGLSFSGFLDTPSHGALTLSAALSKSQQGESPERGSGDSAPLWRLDQRAMPLDGGWMANHSVGALSSLQVAMARGFGRIGLPSSPLEGLTAEYLHGETTALNASLGRPGLYSGLGVNGFNPARGRLLFAGGQQVLPGPGSASSVAFQLFDASGLENRVNAAADRNARGLWSAWRWEGSAPWAGQVAAGVLPLWQREGGLQVQVNAMTSQSSGETGGAAAGKDNGRGAWVDAQWRSQWLQQAAGVFYLQPNLQWGNYTAISDIRGVYWRGDVSTRRWQLTTSTEWTDSVSGTTGANLFANVSGRYRLDTRNTALAAVALRRLRTSAVSAQFGWEHSSDLGRTQWLADLLQASARRSMRLGLDHSFLIDSDRSLSLSAGVERVHFPDSETRSFSWGVIGSARPWSTVSADANLRGTHSSSGKQISGTLGLAWAIDPHWSLLAQFNAVRGDQPEAFALVSTLTQAAAAVNPVISSKRVQLTLRYEDRAGSVSAPLGGAPGMGAGGLQGTVFFDSDSSGRREASESGAANITVVLDRRYVTRTDAQGRYEFPWVVAGEHLLQLQTDNIPLPWNPAQREAVAASVLVRRITTTDFALQRER